jgi:small conductance mechanosensitive channel
MLKPLTKELLIIEANAWQALLRAKAEEISAAEITVLRQNEQINQVQEAAKAAEKAKAAAEKAESVQAGPETTQDAAAVETAKAAAEAAKKKAEEAKKALAKAKKLDAQAATNTTAQTAREVVKKVAEEQKAKAEETGETNASPVRTAQDVASPSLDNVSTQAVAESSTQLEHVANVVKEAAKKEEAEKTALLDVLTELRTQRSALIERFDLVLEELKAKGGDPKPYEQYRDAVAEIIVDVSDTAAVWKFITGWLSSDEGGLKWLFNTLKFVGVLVVFWLLSLILGKLAVQATQRSRGMSQLLRQFVVVSVRRTTLFVGLLIAISAMGINVGPLLALITATGFVIGFALQGTLSNFASGMLMLIYRPFDVGDAVEAGGVSGSVTAMNLMTTHIRTWDNQAMIVPNNQIWGNVITNITGVDKRRVDMVFGIGYGDSIARAEEILKRIITGHPKVLKHPEPVIKVHELADSSVNFVVRPWVLPADYWTVYWDITRQVKEEFDKAGVSIPFPQRDVHVYQEKA